MAMANSGNDSGQQEWRYVCEALQNVHTLRVLLYHATLYPLHDCLNFTAKVRHGSLRCAWASPTGVVHSLAFSLPACLLDFSIPVGCATRHDHVEVRLRLLSVDPALHLLRISLEDEGLDLDSRRHENTKPFSVDFDAQALESSKAVAFFCRQCSCKLTKTPFRRVLELPSMDWREVSEHFYGNCCCASFGAETEFLVARFQQLVTPSQGTCLVASTTCIVYESDVIVSENDKDTLLEPVVTHPLEGGKSDVDPNALSHRGVGAEASHESTSGLGVWKEKTSGSSCAFDHVDCSSNGHHSSSSAEIHYEASEEETTLVSVAAETQEVCVGYSEVSPEESESRSHHHAAQDTCCSSRESASTESSAMKEAKEGSPESLGNCFMTGSGSQSEVRDWEPFLCRNCSSLVGARRGGSSEKGVQFFKYKISTHELVASSSNIFREHTLERLFTHELEKNTESNSSYRYVVRSFLTGHALLQLVLLNQSALVSSGTSFSTSTLNTGDATVKTAIPKFLDSVSTEGRKLHQTVDRKPENVALESVAKFMFCDCRMLSSDELRLIDKWAQVQNADDIFMLDEVAGTLVDMLKLHQMAYPPSCQSYQQFRLSFLTK